ncbi:transposable element Tcb2 transposase [Trichonephila clavipes]|nr:transposable element Tcb2 transposase [Trichonephila clavipes]
MPSEAHGPLCSPLAMPLDDSIDYDEDYCTDGDLDDSKSNSTDANKGDNVEDSKDDDVGDNKSDNVGDYKGRLEGGQSQAEVAQAIGVSQSVISRICNRFLETGSAGRRPRQCRRRATTPNEDRYLVLTARGHRNMNASLLQQHLRSATGTTVSTQAVETGSMV